MKISKQYILDNIDKTENGCWEWLGARTKMGYGRIRVKELGRAVFVHRLAYRFFKGDFEENLFVCHKCDNPPCVNPEHLFVGTQTDNMRDKMKKGRHVKAVAKLNPIQVLEIRRNWKKNKKNFLSEMTKKYNVCESAVSSLIINRTWSDI